MDDQESGRRTTTPSLGALIQQAMHARGLRAVDLAQLTNRTQTAVSKLINDGHKIAPPPDVLDDLHRVLGLSMRDMLVALGYHIEQEAARTPDEGETDIPREITRAMIDAVADNDLEMVQGIIQKIIQTHESRRGVRRVGRPHASPPEPKAPAVPTSTVPDDVLMAV